MFLRGDEGGRTYGCGVGIEIWAVIALITVLSVYLLPYLVGRREMARRSNGYFLDIWELLQGEDGGFAEHLKVDGVRTRVRAHDGVHLSGPGARLLVDTLVPQIHGILG